MRVTDSSGVSQVDLLRRQGLPVSLPDAYNEYAVLAEWLNDIGSWGWLQSVVLDRRAGPFELCDLVIFLVCFFTASARGCSIAEFAEASRGVGVELAGVMGRNRWLTQSSVSRGLGSVGAEAARSVSQHLLDVSSRLALDSPVCASSGYRDGTGHPWRVLFWDATVEAIRQRALPEGAEFPEPIRSSRDLAEPGYTGRKRGEVMFARSIVADATSGVWIHVDLHAGNGSLSDQISRAADASLTFLRNDPDRLAHAVMVCDGVAGGLPQIRALLDRNFNVLTRVSDYDRLKSPAAAARIEQAEWLPVEDSRSGPSREAINLGTHVVSGRRLRVVASRFQTKGRGKGKRRGTGHTIGDWHYELFATTLSPERWAANDLVTLYYGRTAIENRFAAEDREFDLGRVFSYEKPGQLLACAVAMAVWNFRIVAGLATVSEDTPNRRERPRPPSTRSESAESLHEIVAMQHPSGSDDPLDGDPTSSIAEDAASQDHDSIATDVDVLAWCQRNPGWQALDDSIQCPAGQRLHATFRATAEGWSHRFRARGGVCGTCHLLAECSPGSKAPRYRREVNVAHVATDRPSRPCVAAESKGSTESARPAPTFEIAANSPDLPPRLPDAPTLVPSVLRRNTRKILATAALRITARELHNEDEERDEQHMAGDMEARQRRRWTIAQRVAANARPDDDVVVEIAAPSEFLTWHRRLNLMSRSA